MASIFSRLTRLQVAAEKAKNDKIAVFFKDGHTEYLTGGECVLLALNDTGGVLDFEACGPGHGLLPDLLTGLLGL